MNNKILIVDDIDINRDMLEMILGDTYDILQAENGSQALEIVDQYRETIVTILLDLIMPEMDGYEILQELEKRGYIGKIPVLVISSETSSASEGRCFDYGVSDFIHKPFDASLVKKRVDNIVELYLYKRDLEGTVEKQTDTILRQYELLKKQADKLKESNVKIIEILGTVVEERDLESGEHIQRVKGFTRILARQIKEHYPEYGLDDGMVDMIAEASVLHDVGKISIPDNILLKPGRLTPEEFEVMKTHSIRGSEMLKNITDVWDEKYGSLSYDICRHHHERYDGKGYPDGLVGDEIPISAQIVSIADVYDALVSVRVYKDARSKEEAYRMILDGECGTFSPKILDCFKRSREEFEKLADGNY